MLVHRELIALIIVALSATHKVTASSTSSRHLRSPGIELEDSLAADTVFVEMKEEGEERHLSIVAPDPSDGSDAPTPTPVPAACDPGCQVGKICAREYPGAKAKCYPKCPGQNFPPDDNTCNGNGINSVCVYNTVVCGGYAGVFGDFCECNSGSYADSCRPSECGLDGPV
jgi:hypothetical protein